MAMYKNEQMMAEYLIKGVLTPMHYLKSNNPV